MAFEQRPPATLLTARDLKILAALDRCPLTAAQLLKLSVTFESPFTNERRVRERMQTLHAAGRARRWWYATTGRGALCYYTLSPLGYRLLHGEDAPQPAKRACYPVAIAHQHHTYSLAEFIVHTAVGAHQAGAALSGFCRENTLRLDIGTESLYPDCAFQLLAPECSPRSFFVELDSSTESIHSARSQDSWERKLHLYDAFQDITPTRFRLLIVTTRSRLRLDHLLAAAAAGLRNPHRRLVYGVHLADFLAQGQAVATPCFRDHRGLPVAILQPSASRPAAGDRPQPADAEIGPCYAPGLAPAPSVRM